MSIAPEGVSGSGSRSTPHPDGHARKEANNMAIIYDAELEKPDCCSSCIMFTMGISYDRERSYLYVRENSIETNVAYKPCWGQCGDYFLGNDCRSMDSVSVQYFDRPPYDKSYQCIVPVGFCIMRCFENGQPKLMVVDGSFMMCCMKLDCCGKQVGLVPYDKSLCFPLGFMGIGFCDSPNYVTPCQNCFGLCGPVTGKPIVFVPFFPQPKDADEFVAAAQPVMSKYFAK